MLFGGRTARWFSVASSATKFNVGVLLNPLQPRVLLLGALGFSRSFHHSQDYRIQIE